MKGISTMTGGKGTRHSIRSRSLARTMFVLAVTVALCLAMVAAASASVTETNNQWAPAGPSQGDVTQAKTGGDSGVGQIVQAPATPASSSGSSSATVVAIVLAAAAACALVVFGLMRRRTHPQAAKVSSLPGPATARQHTKAA